MASEGHVDVGGARIRYAEVGGSGPTLIHLQDELRLIPAHDLLARHFRVIALEAPRGPEAVATSGRAVQQLGVEAFDLMASAAAGTTALGLALQERERVRALVLESPGAGGGSPPLGPRLGELATPTLVLLGTADHEDAQQTGRAWAERLPNGHLVFVYDATGAIGRDRPEAFAEVVADFLERHEAFIISRTPTVIHP